IGDWNRFEEALTGLGEKRADAIVTLRQLTAAHPSAPVFQATYARSLKEAGRLDAALALYRDAVRKWPRDATLHHDFAVAAREAALASKGPAARTLRADAGRAGQ